MVFSSIEFLFFFLPITLLLYFSAGKTGKNIVLLLCSLFFYAWGEFEYVLLMLCSIVVNWIVGKLIESAKITNKPAKLFLITGIVLNLAPLLFFKYLNFFLDNINLALISVGGNPFENTPIHLPIGISFYTFQAISYIVDVYRRDARAQKNPFDLALYIALFPQLIAGPIVRYSDIAKQIKDRQTRLIDFKEGSSRFIIGLSKKVLIANNMGIVADHIFSLPAETLPAHIAWLGIIAYTLQIYFDFSGYSDMAIGLGRMFGFRFLENFNYPYIAKSVQDFWRRWHISLSSWFRDYVYIPLGGNRHSRMRTYCNLIIVFVLCGVWHGASWNFVFWGAFHGMFLVFERLGLSKILARLPSLLQHTYTLLVVMIGWIFFRAETFPEALGYIAALFNFSAPDYLDAKLFHAVNLGFYIALLAGVIIAMPIYPVFKRWIDRSLFLGESSSGNKVIYIMVSIWGVVCMLSLLFLSSSELVGSSHNPFLYFRF